MLGALKGQKKAAYSWNVGVIDCEVTLWELDLKPRLQEQPVLLTTNHASSPYLDSSLIVRQSHTVQPGLEHVK